MLCVFSSEIYSRLFEILIFKYKIKNFIMGNLSNLLLPVQEIRHSLYNNKAFKCPSNEERLLHHTKFNLKSADRVKKCEHKRPPFISMAQE
jgi:hypothetical protein